MSSDNQPIHILVLEDNPGDLLLLEESLHGTDLQIAEITHAVTLADARQVLAGKRIDLLFLDLSLPRISGLEVLKAIKSTPHLMHIPIVVASGTEDPEHVRAVYALNGNCFMRKPSDLTQFLRFIEMCYEFWGSVVTLSPPPRSFPDGRPLATNS